MLKSIAVAAYSPYDIFLNVFIGRREWFLGNGRTLLGLLSACCALKKPEKREAKSTKNGHCTDFYRRW